jgi:hypothetical protein
MQNLEHKYGATKAQLPRKVNGAQFSIKRRHVPLKDIGNRTWHLAKDPKKTPMILDP